MRTTSLAVASVVTLFTMNSASATVVVTTQQGTTANYAAPASATTVLTFNNPAGTSAEANPKGYQVTFQPEARRFDPAWGLGNTYTDNGTTYSVYTPHENDGSGFFFVGGGGAVTFMGTQALSSISLFIGSLDSSNTIALLDQAGNTIASYAGNTIYSYLSPADKQSYNGDVFTSFTGTAGTSFYGITLSNPGAMVSNGTTQSFEFDNVAFTAAAVPEPATWAMMVGGFGLIGGAMRRRKASVSFA